MIPETTAEKLEEAMATFDSSLRGSKEWQEWEQRGNFKWAIEHGGQYYPVKKIISLATGVGIDSFSSGGEANFYLAQRGFNVVALRSNSPVSIEGRNVLQ